MVENIKRGMIQSPAEENTGDIKEAIIERGVRTPKSSFDKRVNGVQGPVTYVGPSKIESR